MNERFNKMTKPHNGLASCLNIERPVMLFGEKEKKTGDSRFYFLQH